MPKPRPVGPAGLRSRLERTFDFTATRVRAAIDRDPDYFSDLQTRGRWKHDGALWTDWCAGFHAGMMWLVHLRMSDSWWRARAEHYSRLLEHQQHDRDVYDFGFIFLNTYKP